VAVTQTPAAGTFVTVRGDRHSEVGWHAALARPDRGTAVVTERNLSSDVNG
jgi:hypothetical protein